MPFAFFPNEQCNGILQGEDGSLQIDFDNDNLATWKVRLCHLAEATKINEFFRVIVILGDGVASEERPR